MVLQIIIVLVLVTREIRGQGKQSEIHVLVSLSITLVSPSRSGAWLAEHQCYRRGIYHCQKCQIGN